MQRIDPRPEPTPQSNTPPPQDGQHRGPLSAGFASTGSNPHTQSFEEIYGVPENFLEIEVCRTLQAACAETRGGAREDIAMPETPRAQHANRRITAHTLLRRRSRTLRLTNPHPHHLAATRPT